MVNSPCIRQCCLDPNDICLGCKRHLSEILAWSKADDEMRNEILSLCQKRQQGLGGDGDVFHLAQKK